MRQTYYIQELHEYMTFDIDGKMHDGTLVGKDINARDVFIYTDGHIEIVMPKNKKPNKVYKARLLTNESLNPYQYIHAGEIRDKRTYSMCARPYYPYRR